MTSTHPLPLAVLVFVVGCIVRSCDPVPALVTVPEAHGSVYLRRAP